MVEWSNFPFRISFLTFKSFFISSWAHLKFRTSSIPIKTRTNTDAIIENMNISSPNFSWPCLPKQTFIREYNGFGSFIVTEFLVPNKCSVSAHCQKNRLNSSWQLVYRQINRTWIFQNFLGSNQSLFREIFREFKELVNNNNNKKVIGIRPLREFEVWFKSPSLTQPPSYDAMDPVNEFSSKCNDGNCWLLDNLIWGDTLPVKSLLLKSIILVSSNAQTPSGIFPDNWFLLILNLHEDLHSA